MLRYYIPRYLLVFNSNRRIYLFVKEVLTGKYGEDSKLIYDLADQGIADILNF